jgi:ribosomal protein S18 acetylase RimI-like enzyme
MADKGDGEESEMVGTIVCKADLDHDVMKGYVAMLTVNKRYRKKGIGIKLAMIGIERMIAAGCVEIVLETEVCTYKCTSCTQITQCEVKSVFLVPLILFAAVFHLFYYKVSNSAAVYLYEKLGFIKEERLSR